MLLEQVSKLEEEKKQLETSLTEREDKLRKLKMVKLYRSKVVLMTSLPLLYLVLGPPTLLYH